MRGKLHSKKGDTPESPFRYTAFRTAKGWVAVLGSKKGLLAVALPHPSKESALEELGANMDNAAPDDGFFSDIVSRLRDYFAGEQVSFDDELDTSHVTPFQAKVWQAAQTISYGQTRSYAWLARQIGKPAAARAVGQAIGRNRLPVIVPCHRVIASDGTLGGFTGSLETKKCLLDMEAGSLQR